MADMGRPDMSAFGSLGGLGSSVDAQQLIEQMRANLAKTTEIRDRARELVGRATSDDGNVRVTFTGEAGLAELSIDPRAMRLPSQELAERIVRLTGQARADLERQRAELVAEAGHDTAELSQESSAAMLGELSTAYARSMDDIQTVFERFRRQTRG